MRLCDFYKIHSFLADLLYSNTNLSSSGHKLTKFHDLVKKNEVEKKSDFPHFFSNSAVSWLWGTLTVTKLKTKGPHGQKHVLSCSKNSTRKFQLVCWNFDFCILGRFLQIRPSVPFKEGQRWQKINYMFAHLLQFCIKYSVTQSKISLSFSCIYS